MDIQTKAFKQKIYKIISTLLVICFTGVLGVSWISWQTESDANRMADVVQSVDFADILHDQKNEDQLNQELNKLWDMHNETPKQQGIRTVRDVFSATNPVANQENKHADKNAGNAYLDGMPDYQSDSITLALRTISISQGQAGVENWRLEADWATLRQSSSVMRVHKPYLLYQLQQTKKNTKKNEVIADSIPATFIVDNSNAVSMRSQNGFVFDDNTKIRLIQNVEATYQLNRIDSEILNYDDATNMATFSESPRFSGDNLKGKALELSWDLNNNRIIGKGRVEFIWTPSPSN